MSPRLLRIDARLEARLDVMVFRADSVRFEPCATFRARSDAELCDCGWLEVDHAGAGSSVTSTRRHPRRRALGVSARRAS